MKNNSLHKILFILLAMLFFTGCSSHTERKIKLVDEEDFAGSNNQAVARVLQVSPEEQRSVAIFYFKNKTSDSSLDWLERGLTDMLSTRLGQSPYLRIIPLKQLEETGNILKKSDEKLSDRALAIRSANYAKAQALLIGNFSWMKDSLIISIELVDPETSALLRMESVKGAGLENIFGMVDVLTEKIRSNLRGALDNLKKGSVQLSEITHSIDAFHYYSDGLQNLDKFLYADAENSFRLAIEADTGFAAAYLRLARVQFLNGKVDEAKVMLTKSRKHISRLSPSDNIYLRFMEAEYKREYDILPKLLEEKLAFAPYDTEIRFMLAKHYEMRGDLNKCLELFETIVDIDPNWKLIYNDLAYLYAWRGDFNTALKYIEKYRQLAPDEPNPQDSQGEILMMAGRLDEAAIYLQDALIKWPQFYHSAQRLSELFSESGDLKRALAYSGEAMQSAPSDKVKYTVLLTKSQTLWKFGKNEEAVDVLRPLLKSEIPVISAVRLAAEIYKASGDTARVKSLYRTIFERFSRQLHQKGYDPETGYKLFIFLMEAEMPPGEVIPVIKTMISKEENANQRARYNFLLIRELMRDGQQDAANKYSEQNLPALLNLFMEEGHANWSSTFKYIFATLGLDKYDNRMADEFSSSFLDLATDQNSPDLRLLAKLVLAWSQSRRGNEEKADEIYRELGIPGENEWQVIGPFSARHVSGFRTAFPPENSIDLHATYSDNGRSLRWISGDDHSSDGYLNLAGLFRQPNWAAAYGLTYVYSPAERKVQFRLGTDEACKVWLNNNLIWQHYYKEQANLDRDIITVLLRPGYNKLLIKVTNSHLDWGYYFRITDEKGAGFADISFHSPSEVGQQVADYVEGVNVR